LIIGIYDYLGYFTTAYMGDELRNPGRTMPGSILISVIAMMFVYLALNISVLGVVPWHEVATSK
jgi:amino acid transporter